MLQLIVSPCLQHVGEHGELMAEIMAQPACLLHIGLETVVLLRLYFQIGCFQRHLLIFRDAVCDFVKQAVDKEDEDEKDKNRDNVYF